MVISMFDRFAFLAIASTFLGLSGCSFFGDPGKPMEILRDEIRATVADPDRAEEMVAAVDRIDQLLMQSAEELAEAARQERTLLTDYDSTPQDFEALFAAASRERRRLQEATLDAHLEFKANATPEEWESLLPLQARAISLRIESLIVAAIAERG